MELVSCLCVTRNRAALLRRAIDCFRAQTHPARELVVLHESDDAVTREYLATLSLPAVRPIEVPALPKRPLGALRNLAVGAARGRYVMQWDDDDWHGPERIAAQLAAVESSGKAGCVLRRWTIYDAVTRQAWIGAPRTWEGSLLMERFGMPAYPELPRGEDTVVIRTLNDAGKLAPLDRPDLYVYVYHGANTWARSHLRRSILGGAEELPPEEARRIGEMLGYARR